VNETVTKRDDPPMIAEARSDSRFPFEHLIEGFTNDFELAFDGSA
jgi:hypothetical protein